VLLEDFFGGLEELESNQFIASLFESGDDFTNQSAVDSVGLGKSNSR
jgi:hypothetical protein